MPLISLGAVDQARENWSAKQEGHGSEMTMSTGCGEPREPSTLDPLDCF